MVMSLRSTSVSGRNEESGLAPTPTASATTAEPSLAPSQQSTPRNTAPRPSRVHSMEPTASTAAASATSTGTNILTSNAPTTYTESTQPTSSDTLATVTENAGGSPVENRKQKTVTSKRSKRSRKIAKMELELIELQVRLKEAKLRKLREEERDSSNSDTGTEITEQEHTGRIENWVMDTTLLTIADRGANNSHAKQEPEGKRNPTGHPQDENYSLVTQERRMPAHIEQIPAVTQPLPPGIASAATNAQPPLGAAKAALFSHTPEVRHSAGAQPAPPNGEQFYRNSVTEQLNIVNSDKIVNKINVVNSANQMNSMNSDYIVNNAHVVNKVNQVNSAGVSASVINGGAEFQVAAGANRYVHNSNNGDIVRPGATAPAGVIAGPPRTEMGELASALMRAIQTGTQSTSRRFSELPAYSGAYQEWLAFKASYEESASALTETENVGRLRHCLKGRAKESVQSLLIYKVQPDAIMKTLESRFGKPDAIAIAEIDRLRSLARLTDSDRDLCVFASRVANIIATLQALKLVHYLYNPELKNITIQKLTPTLKNKWYEYTTVQDTSEPDLIKLARFLDREAAICGPYAQPEIETTSPSNKKRGKTYAVNSQEEKKLQCPACQQSHNITKCENFIQATTDDRWDMAKRHKLCFRCLKLRTQNHRCPKKACATEGCQRWHHPMLHFQRKEDRETEKVASSRTLTESRTFLKIVPVTVSGPKGQVRTYALLDDGSKVTLVDEAIADTIGASGPNDPLTIESIANATVKEMKSRRITFQVTGADETHEIQARTVKSLKLSPQSIALSDVQNIEHLRSIKGDVLHRNAKPRILIGQDNWHLLVTTRMQTGEITQPAASLTPLGWVLHGSQTRSLDQRVQYIHNVTVDEDSTRDIPADFNGQHRWCVGPEFIKADPATWPTEEHTTVKETGEEHTLTLNIEQKKESNLGKAPPDRFAKYQRLVRTTARVFQFIDIRRRKPESVEFKRTVRNTDSDTYLRTKGKTTQKQRREIQLTADEYLPIESALLRRTEKDSQGQTKKQLLRRDAFEAGKDGVVRAIDMRTKGGVLRRPTKKAIILPRDQPSSTTEGSSGYGGATGRREDVPDGHRVK